MVKVMSRKKFFSLNEALKHPDHRRPLSRREFISQGFMKGSGLVLGSSLLGLATQSSSAWGALSSDIQILKDTCGIASLGAGKIPFICIDLAGGANIAGSNVLVGGRGGQLDFLSTAGYSKLGLPAGMTPAVTNPDTNTNDFVNSDLGLAFHTDSAFLRGIQEKTAAATQSNTNGAVIPSRSDNDTGNNPHNPMYGIYRAGANGSLAGLIGSRSSDSGGNSMAPLMMINPEVRPTKVDRPSDVTGMVDIGDLVGLLSQDDAVSVMESIQRISDQKLAATDFKVSNQSELRDRVSCAYVKSADLADRFGDPSSLDPALDTNIVGDSGIFTQAEFDGDSEFQKTASVMKMAIDGLAGCGTITMSGYDYHTGDRATGEVRDLRAGRCMGACLEYAARMGKPLMLYVFSDGSVASNGMVDESADGRGKGVWTADNSSTGASFFLVYNPSGKPQLRGATADDQFKRQQIGFMRADASVDTSGAPAANNVNLLAETVILNYMALHGEEGLFAQADFFPRQGLGADVLFDQYIAFEGIVSGTIS